MKGVVSHQGHATLNRLVFCNRDDLGGHDVGDFYLARVEALGDDFSQEILVGHNPQKLFVLNDQELVN